MTRNIDNNIIKTHEINPAQDYARASAQSEDHSITLTGSLAKEILLDRETREKHIPVNTQKINSEAIWILDPISDSKMWNILKSIPTRSNLDDIEKDLSRQAKDAALLTLTQENLNALLKQWDKAAVLIDNALICRDFDPQHADLELLEKYNQLPKNHPMRELVERRQKEREEMKKSASEPSSHNSSPSSGSSASISSGSELDDAARLSPDLRSEADVSKTPSSGSNSHSEMTTDPSSSVTSNREFSAEKEFDKVLWDETTALLEGVIEELTDALKTPSFSSNSHNEMTTAPSPSVTSNRKFSAKKKEKLNDSSADSSSSSSSSNSKNPNFNRWLASAQSLFDQGFPHKKIPLGLLTDGERQMFHFLKSKSLSKEERAMRMAILRQIEIPFGRE